MIDNYGDHMNHISALPIFEEERFRILTNIGIPSTKDAIFDAIGALPVIKRYELDYISQAYLNDKLSVTSTLFADGAKLTFHQSLTRGIDDVVKANVLFAFVNRAGRTIRTPIDLLKRLNEMSLR